MVLQSPTAIVRVLLFGIPAEFQAPFAQSYFSWVQIEPFAHALLDLFGIKFRLKGASGCPKWCSFENPFFNGLLADDVLFNDSFDAIR